MDIYVYIYPSCFSKICSYVPSALEMGLGGVSTQVLCLPTVLTKRGYKEMCLSFLLTVTRDPQEATSGWEALFWLMAWKGAVHHDGEGMATEP